MTDRDTSWIEQERDSRTEPTYRVSALVSVYNSANYLEGLFQDLTAQTLYARGELELVVIDSGSPDPQDWALIEQAVARYPHIRAIRSRRRETLYQAWNRAIGEARGEYLTNANTDDRHAPHALEVLADTLDAHPDALLAYGDGWINRTDQVLPFDKAPREEDFTTPAFFAPALALYYSYGFQPLWRASVHDRIGVFDGAYKAAGDWDFGLRLALTGKAVHVPRRLGVFYAGGESISYRDDTMAKESQQVSNRYRQPEIIEQLYAREDVIPGSKLPGHPPGHPVEVARTCLSGNEPGGDQTTRKRLSVNQTKARIYVDFGLRALEFINPMGGRRRLYDLAVHYFERATQLQPQWGAPWTNIAVTLALAGNTKQALELLTTAANTFNLPQIPCNRETIQKGLSPLERYSGLRPVASGLDLPTQFELAAGRDRRTEADPRLASVTTSNQERGRA